MALLNSMKISSEAALEMINMLFGPNTLKKLAMRRNQDLLQVLGNSITAGDATAFIDSLNQQFDVPNISEHYPIDEMWEDEEGPVQKGKNKEQNRMEAIQCYCMQVVAMVPVLFKTSLNEGHVQQCFDLLVPAAYRQIEVTTGPAGLSATNIQQHAQFKLFSLIQLLQKIKIGEAAKKGFFTEADGIDMTVLFRINKSINKVLA